MVVDISKPGKTTIKVTVGPPSETKPKGGTYNRLAKILLCPSETWDNAISRILDFWETGHTNGK